MRSTFLYVAYKPEWGDNRIRDILLERGCEVEVICPALGDPVPVGPDGYDGVIVGGSLDDVIESSRQPYVEQLIEFTRTCIERSVPFVGVCFGAQLLAAAGGGRVLERSDRQGAFGYRPIHALDSDDCAILEGLDHAYHLHFHGFEAPSDAVRLAAGSLFPDTAFRLGTCAYGFQFHPEIRADQIEAVVSDLGAAALERPGADPLERHLRDAEAHDAGIHAWMNRFLEDWCRVA